MRKLMILMVVMFVAASVGVFADGDMTLDQILASNLEARGGREAMDAVKSMKLTGKMAGGPMEFPVTMLRSRPNSFRVEFTFQGMTGMQVFSGDTGWKLIPFGGQTDAEPMSEDEVKDASDQADFDGPLIDWKKKGHKLELVGKEELEGSEVYKLKLARANGDEEFHFLDAEFFLTVKVSSKKDFQGTETEIETTFGDFKEVEGMMFAHFMENKAKGSPQGQKMTFDSYELNVDVPKDLFDMPAPEAPAAEEAP
jgi:hypothetical protein